jgi:hypothetical protein
MKKNFIYIICLVIAIVNFAVGKKMNIAVIGANFDGISFSHYLLKNSTEKANITIFDKNDFNRKYQKHYPYIYNDWNKNLKELLQEFKTNISIFDSFKNLSIFDGDSLIFKSSLKDSANLFKKMYGDSMEVLVKILRRFGNEQHSIYDVISKSPKQSLLDIIQTSKLDTILLQTRTDQFLLNLGTNLSFINGFVEPLLNSYTSMQTELNIYTGLLTLFSHFTIKYEIPNGIYDLLFKMIYDEKYYNKLLHLMIPYTVKKIKYLPLENKYQVFYEFYDNHYSQKYDKVVLAEDLYKNKIEFIGFLDKVYENINSISKINKKPIYSYILKGELDFSFFKSNFMSDLVFVTREKGFSKFFRIENVNKNKIRINVRDNETAKISNSVYRLYSIHDLKEEDFKQLFLKGYSLEKNSTRKMFNSELIVKDGKLDESQFNIVLDGQGLYYLKCYKSLSSNLEYASIVSKNTANLILLELKNSTWSEKEIYDHMYIDL